MHGLSLAYNIQYIKNPSERVQLEAVKRDFHLIRYIKNPSDLIKKMANNNRWEEI